ncbi:MAG: cobalamin B12-binding domain-containing protein, partial [Desulfatiglandales bacterium]|nr:cobalamin B12-binding domain-containing protein [Desulfatiglandales bacterium]
MDMPYAKKDIEDFLDELFPRRSIKKVLLVNPPDSHAELFQYDTAKRGRYSSYPPYGLAVLAQNLRDVGVEARICNLNHEILKKCCESENSENFDFDEIWQDLLDQDVASFQPDFIGVTCMFTMSHESLKRVCARVSSKGIPFGIGGVHVSNDMERVLDDIPTIPIVFLREGDLVVKNFVAAVNQSIGIENLGQMVLNSGSSRIHLQNECVPGEGEMDTIPAWDLVDTRNISKYGVTGVFKHLTPPGTRVTT